MTKDDAIRIFGSIEALADFLAVKPRAIKIWPRLLPDKVFREILGGLLLAGRLDMRLLDTDSLKSDKHSSQEVKVIKKLYRLVGTDCFVIFLTSHQMDDKSIQKLQLCEEHVSNRKVYIINNNRSILGIGYYGETILEPSPSPNNSNSVGGSGGMGEEEPKFQPRRNSKSKPAKQEITLSEYLISCQAENKLPIPAEHCVFAYANRVGLPEEFLLLAWKVFKRKYTDSAKQKKYKDWTLVFNNAVKENWLRLWYLDYKRQYSLTTVGLQAELEFRDE